MRQFAEWDLLRMQREQYLHDRRNHADVMSLPRGDRLKHYGLHFAKYVGRLARSLDEVPEHRTPVDVLLIALSAANTLQINLATTNLRPTVGIGDDLRRFADAVGRFADACEKIDHLEEFLDLARQADVDIVAWVFGYAVARAVPIEEKLRAQRKRVSGKLFYIEE